VVCAVGADGSNPTKASLAGLYKRSPLLGAVLLVGMFGLAGIPPTAGFAGKWFLFSAAIDSGLFWLVIVGAVNATVSLFYYLRIVREAYLTPPVDDTPLRVPASMALASWLAIALVVVGGVYPKPLWALAEAAAAVLFGR
jgi:NADH-quinone oxidoreductase subunit N